MHKGTAGAGTWRWQDLWDFVGIPAWCYQSIARVREHGKKERSKKGRLPFYGDNLTELLAARVGVAVAHSPAQVLCRSC